jgi:hypothetical protein
MPDKPRVIIPAGEMGPVYFSTPALITKKSSESGFEPASEYQQAFPKTEFRKDHQYNNAVWFQQAFETLQHLPEVAGAV